MLSMPMPYLPAIWRPAGETVEATAIFEVRLGVGRDLQAGFGQLEPVGLHVDRAVLPEQRQDRLERLVHALALIERVDAHHPRVGRERAGSDAHHHAAAGHVVELDHPVDHHQRVVVGQRDHAGAQADVAGALGGGGDEDLGRRDQLPAGGVVLADPGFVVAELIEPLDQLQVAVDRQRGILAHAVKGRHENAEVHASVRCHVVPHSDSERSALP